MLAAAAAWWVAPLKTPDTRASQSPGRRMHVAEIQPTDADIPPAAAFIRTRLGVLAGPDRRRARAVR